MTFLSLPNLEVYRQFCSLQNLYALVDLVQFKGITVVCVQHVRCKLGPSECHQPRTSKRQMFLQRTGFSVRLVECTLSHFAVHMLDTVRHCYTLTWLDLVHL